MSQDSNFHALAVLRDSYRSRYPVVPLSDEFAKLLAMLDKIEADDVSDPQ